MLIFVKLKYINMATQTDIHKRVHSIATQLESGRTNSEIIKDCTEQWGISSCTVERYMALAKKILFQKMEGESINNEAKQLIEIIKKSGLQMRNPELKQVLNGFQKSAI
jgi:hypothetical protein